MIIPVVVEEEWQHTLAPLPSFECKASRILLVSPHPDDETLGAGAFLAHQRSRGVEVAVAAVTDGENAYRENQGLAAIRREEQMAALGKLGVEPAQIHRFALPDSDVTAHTPRLVELLQPLVAAGTCLLAPWTGDFHPDHEACGRAAHEVAARTGASLYWYFFWTWHRGTPETLHVLDLRAFRFDDSLLAIKLAALSCHRSQLHREEEEPVLPERLLAPARRNFEVFARA
jgi:LmbE family N-acetylglucosaminyl deacetylase